MPGFDWNYEGGRKGFGSSSVPNAPMILAVGVPQVPLFYPDQAKLQIAHITLDTLRLALAYLAGHVSDAAPVDSGQLAQSFGADPASPTGGIEVLGTDIMAGVTGRVFSSLPYAIVMEDGRRPGAPISRAGIDAIGHWAQRKLGLSSDEADSAKWAIASSIVANGIEGKKFADKGFNSARPGIELMFKDLGESVVKGLTTTPTQGGG